MPARVFTITELRRTGQGQLVATPVVFRWDAASHTVPQGPISTPLRLTTSRTEPPGSGEVVEQVVTSAWQAQQYRGRWDDRYAGPGYAKATLEAFSKLVRRGSLVRVEFESMRFEGLITEFVPHRHRENLVEYEFTLSPHKDNLGDIRAGRIIQPTSRPMRDAVAQALELANGVVASWAAAADIPQTDSFWEKVGDKIDNAITLATEASDLVTKGFVADTVSQLNHVAARFRAVRGAAQTVVEAGYQTRSDVQVAVDDVTQTLKFESWTRNMAADSKRLIVHSHEGEEDAKALARQRPRAIYRPVKNESLYAVSRRFYGTADEWRRIYEFNHLSSLYLDGTEELIIPERAP